MKRPNESLRLPSYATLLAALGVALVSPGRARGQAVGAAGAASAGPGAVSATGTAPGTSGGSAPATRTSPGRGTTATGTTSSPTRGPAGGTSGTGRGTSAGPTITTGATLGANTGAGPGVAAADPMLVPSGTADTRPGAPGEQSLTLAEAVALARRNVPTVLVAFSQQAVAEAQYAQTRAALLPTVTGNASAGASWGQAPTYVLDRTMPTAIGMVQNAMSTALYVDATVGLRWTLFDLGAIRRLRASAYALDGARADVRAGQRLAVAQAAAAYYALLADEEVVASTTEIVRQRERELEISRGLVEAGARAPIEQTRSQVALDTARLDLAVAEARVQNDATTLAAALALDPTRRLRAVHPAELPVDSDPARAADLAVRNRPELVAVRLRLRASETQVSAAWGSYVPSVGIQGSVGARYTQRGGVNSGNAGLSETASGVATLSVPIFDPTVNANVRAAEAQRAVVRAQFGQQVLAVRTDAVQAAIAVRTARESLAQAERLAAGAAANLAQAQGRYQAGAAPILELVDAQAADATARLRVIQQRLTFEQAKVGLLAAVGRLDALDGAR